jgi:hypothetical protein
MNYMRWNRNDLVKTKIKNDHLPNCLTVYDLMLHAQLQVLLYREIMTSNDAKVERSFYVACYLGRLNYTAAKLNVDTALMIRFSANIDYYHRTYKKDFKFFDKDPHLKFMKILFTNKKYLADDPSLIQQKYNMIKLAIKNKLLVRRLRGTN